MKPDIREAWQMAALAVVEALAAPGDCAVDITEDEADVLVSKRREHDEQQIPLEQVDADDVA